MCRAGVVIFRWLVDLKDQDHPVDTLKRMGLFEQINAKRRTLQSWERKNAADQTVRRLALREPGECIEIERDLSLSMLYDSVKQKVNFKFNNNITEMEKDEDAVNIVPK